MISRNNFRGSVNRKPPRIAHVHTGQAYHTMASFVVEAMVRGIHEFIRGLNFHVLVEIRENLEN